MGISDNNEVLYATISKDLKQWLQEKADCEKRSLSAQVAYMLEQQHRTEVKTNGNAPIRTE